MPTRSLIFSLFFGGCLGLASCAAHHPPAPPPTTLPIAAPTTEQTRASLSLDEIEPRPQLAPATQPAGEAPLAALELYARARDDLASGRRFIAITELERAVRLDPQSAELQRLLARAYLESANANKALDALEKACDLDPDDLSSQTALGRLDLLRGDGNGAPQPLRLARETSDYSTDEAGATIADYFLARALLQQGYDQAAIDQFQKVRSQIENPTRAIRTDAELNSWATRPELIDADLARLYEKHGRNEEALAAWEDVAAHDSGDLDARGHALNMLLALDRRHEALQEAAQVVRNTGASPRSLELLRQVARRAGDEEAVFDELRKLHREQPKDRAILYALADLLAQSGRADEAESVLMQSAQANWDGEVVRRLFRFYRDRDQNSAAAKLLIEASAARPADATQLSHLFEDLLRPMQRDALQVADVEAIDVSPSAAAAKKFAIAATAAASARFQLTQQALDEATRIAPPYPPAFVAAIQRLQARAELSEAEKQKLADDLIARAGPIPGLPDELRGWLADARDQKADAAKHFEAAFAAHRDSPDAALAYAELLLARGEHQAFESTIWRLVSDHPTDEDAYVRLINDKLSSSLSSTTAGPAEAAAMAIVQRWLAADPTSVSARLEETLLLSAAGQTADAVREGGELLRQNPENPDVLTQIGEVFDHAGQSAHFQEQLEEMFATDPRNLALASELIALDARADRTADALHVVDSAKSAASDDARAMYVVAQFYNQLDQKDLSQQALEAALKIDPNDAGSNNDLGYNLAEQGKDLDRAETIIRRAISAEPDNSSFLDSLGWVLYKRGKFDEAKIWLQKAIEGDPSPDPVVINHLGDALYRLKSPDAARQQWQRAMERLTTVAVQREELVTLRMTLETKLRQIQLGQPASASPYNTQN